jgi:hypothetical protein
MFSGSRTCYTLWDCKCILPDLVGVELMQAIRIPADQWGTIWRALVASGPISRLGEEPVYLVSDEQVRLLQKKKLPFEVVPLPNGRARGADHGLNRPNATVPAADR